ncbi:MAG TPA: hypothetical protein VHK67_06730 [Rhabdochlamydiaceae bacterium]|jgi:hypothetical protein|nr:hypothetical protein [Rhabdochlamydiaceae bacterium]
MKKIVLGFLVLSSLLYCNEPEEEKTEYKYEPIYAGTLLAFFPDNIPPGYVLLEPYLFAGTTNGVYNAEWEHKHSFNFFDSQLLFLVETGITSWLDVSLTVNENYSVCQGRKSTHFGDTRLGLGFQVTKNKPESAVPDFRILLMESFPTGKYQHLDPRKHIADVTGSGAFETWIIAIVRKIIYFTPTQVVSLNFNLGYDIPSIVHVKGYNLYGGAPKTNGSVHPGHQTLGNIGIEYSLTMNWILGLDVHYVHQNKSTSSHRDIHLPSSEEFSLAPCIEYNPSTHFGIEAGAWFSIAGRNNLAFTSGVLTVYWYF